MLAAALGFGPCTTYHAEIQRALVGALQKHADLTWVRQIQTAGTDAHNEFVGQVYAAATADPAWLRRSMKAAISGLGTPFDELVARVVRDDFNAHDRD